MQYFVVLLFVEAFAYTFYDDFSKYEAESFLTSYYNSSNVNFMTKTVFSKVVYQLSGKSTFVCYSTPKTIKYISIGSASAIIEPVENFMPGTSYGVTGLALLATPSQYWSLNLVVQPESNNYKHSAELGLIYNNSWPIQGKYVSKSHYYVKKDWSWAFNTKYNMTISIDRTMISGLIFSEAKELLYNATFLFNATESYFPGAPTFKANGVKTNYYKISAGASEFSDKTYKVFPKYDARLGCDYPPQQEATGFFRVSKNNVDKKWWFYDPNGYPYFIIGANSINPYDGYDYVLDYEEWYQVQTDRLKSWGFNALPNWVDTKMFHRGLPHSTNHDSSVFIVNFDYIIPKQSWTGFPNVFSDLWKPYLEITLRDVEENKNDSWIIGHFFDNEMEWWGKTEERGTEKGDWNLFNSTWLLPKNHTAKIAASKIIEKYLKEKNRLNDITNCFEEYFGVKNINSINDYLDSYKGGIVWSTEGKEIGALYMKEVAERYFSAIKETFQKYDKNHLYFCTRFPGSSPSIGEIVNKYCDINTFNIYPFVSPISGVPDSTIKSVRKISNFAPDIPLMVTEWSFPALDAGLPSQVGAGTRVDNQVQKSNAVKFFMAQLMNMENVIGAHYFRYLDQSQHGNAETFQENSNYGLVNGTDYPYDLLTKTLKEVNENYCRRRLGNFSYNDYLPNKEVLYANTVKKEFTFNATKQEVLHFNSKIKTRLLCTKTIESGVLIVESDKTVELYYQTDNNHNKTMEVCFILPKGSVSDSTVNPFMAVRITYITDKLSLSSEIVNYRVVSVNVLINMKDFGSEAVCGETSGNYNYWKPEEYVNVPKLNVGMGVWAFPDAIRIDKNYGMSVTIGQSFGVDELMDENGSFAPNKFDLKKEPNLVFFPFESNCSMGGYGCYNQILILS
ncbi:hypothetical protein EIN_327190 [Entamoeba invadens IP1]|uniref:Agarase n=1 Tax=Entamoeba invadens IP1 TaxID=370355 RepID=A0A0A1TXG8_ENTIV|nr:hypothetical protein EIN_327190 [Entamoeba invadens IP1]ELP86072.1 hypothetical protein EIN_327190 [Entamoeba invadens IP1]|eukprot:XP_004185418.1 hypothetical protein EIN_327190 [Entamoeba invadens IP1]